MNSRIDNRRESREYHRAYSLKIAITKCVPYLGPLPYAFYFWEKMHLAIPPNHAADGHLTRKSDGKGVYGIVSEFPSYERAIVSRHAWPQGSMDSACIRENHVGNINKSIYGTGKSKQASEMKALADVFTEAEFRAVLSSVSTMNSLEWKFVVEVPVWRAKGMCHSHVCLNLFSTGDKTVTFRKAWISFEIAGVMNKRIRSV